MHPNYRLFSLLGILSLSLVSLPGCGEKRIHVSTASGDPGDEMALVPIDENSQAQVSGLGNDSVDESLLSSQIPDSETASEEPTVSAMVNDSLADLMASTQESEFPDKDASVATLNDGQDFSAQSGSSSSSSQENPLNHSSENFREPVTTQHSDSETTPFSQDFSDGLEDTLSGEGIEPIPDTFQIAKAEPSDGLQERMNQLKKEELAAAAAGLEDVFFQFDSWTLTQEGKQSLQRTLGWFEQEPSSNLIIEGHADQRGTQAYNMVLAKKRAVAVLDYLSQLGVNTSRLAVISYGKDKPFCQDATEVCYQLNRRGHLIVQNP